jgi:hypothetical protein
MKSKEIEAYTGIFACILTGMQRHVGATFSKVPAHYPDPGNPGN